MSPKQWLALLFFYVSYLIFGASIFYHIEHGLEAEKRAYQLEERIEVNGKYLVETEVLLFIRPKVKFKSFKSMSSENSEHKTAVYNATSDKRKCRLACFV